MHIESSISATPGITVGGRIVTNIGYGPADPSRKISGDPTCALTPPAPKMSNHVTSNPVMSNHARTRRVSSLPINYQ